MDIKDLEKGIELDRANALKLPGILADEFQIENVMQFCADESNQWDSFDIVSQRVRITVHTVYDKRFDDNNGLLLIAADSSRDRRSLFSLIISVKAREDWLVAKKVKKAILAGILNATA